MQPAGRPHSCHETRRRSGATAAQHVPARSSRGNFVQRRQEPGVGVPQPRRAERQRADPAVAIPAGAAVGPGQPQLHRLGRHQRGVQADRPRRGGAALGRAEEQAQHELRQAEPGAALLLRQEHHDQGARQALRLQVRLPRAGPGLPARRPRARPLQIPGQPGPAALLGHLQTQPHDLRGDSGWFFLLARLQPVPLPRAQPAALRPLQRRGSLPPQQHEQPLPLGARPLREVPVPIPVPSPGAVGLGELGGVIRGVQGGGMLRLCWRFGEGRGVAAGQ